MVGKWHLTGYKYQDAQFEVRPTTTDLTGTPGAKSRAWATERTSGPHVFRTQPIRWLDLPENRMGKDEY